MASSRAFCFGYTLLVTVLAVLPASADNISIVSPAFKPGLTIPKQFAYKGDNISPELHIGNVPSHTRSLVLIVDDPDSPSGLWTHWLVWNLPPDIDAIPAGNVPGGASVGKNSFGNSRYDGPAPPSGKHRYFFHIYALDTTLTVPAGADRATLEKAMAGHVVGEGEMIGMYAAE